MTKHLLNPDLNTRIDATTLQANHHLVPGTAEFAASWLHIADFLPWLDRVGSHCEMPAAHLTKVSEWLLDNEFQLRRCVRQIDEDLSKEFYQRLPRLGAPEYQGLPRVMAVARALLDGSQLQVSLASVVEFVNIYQEGGALTIAELWALPTMLRLICLEEIVHSFTELMPELAPPFALTPRSVLNQPLPSGESISRSISTLVVLASISWETFFEKTSQVENILQTDPARVYALMDFDTRDRYRKAVEQIAAHSLMTESQVASEAVTLASNHAFARRQGHVGFWLVAEGRATLERNVDFKISKLAQTRRWLLSNPGKSYASLLAGFTLLAMVLPVWLFIALNASGWAWWVGLPLSLAPAMIIAVTVAHWLITRLVSPRVLPKLNVDKGLQPGWETAVVMPVILRQATEVTALLEQLEMHWLANPDPLIRLALLSDLADAKVEHLPEDDLVETALVEGIRHLNTRYPEHQPFALLHRRRRWNAAQKCWMGWERKRGKLEELVCFIMHQQLDGFSLYEGDIEALRHTQFIVTLDADTRSQANGINRLIGTLAHPLNRVEFDPDCGKAMCGYTFIQPRVEIAPDTGNRSRFTQLFSGDTAIDIYSRAVSDVYQDLFGEGIFTGKGAFDVAAFYHCLHDRVPENSILSHDLFEGLHGRTALVSDIVFYEDFPSNYLSYTRRALRWIRGDWQLTPWLLNKVAGRGGKRLPTRFSRLDRWKLLDNLRRSLIAPMLIALAVVGWLLLPGSAWLWTLLAVGALSTYFIIDLVMRLSAVEQWSEPHHLLRPLLEPLGRWLLAVVFLAHEATVSMTAITRALWRMHVSRRYLLEWTSAAHSAEEVSQTGLGTWREMIAAPLLSVVIVFLLAVLKPSALLGASPLLVLWFISPHIAWLISKPRPLRVEELNTEDRQYLRLIARRTWLYFETFAGPDDNWLPPDNYQAAPHEETAHRSSPTNVGMLFLSALTALDLGHIGRRDLEARMAAALDALDRLESPHGHTLNWFDTRTLESLAPSYISTVDSGNLAVCLLTLSAGCREAATGSILPVSRWEGLADTLQLLRESLVDLSGPEQGTITVHLDEMLKQLSQVRLAPQDWYGALVKLSQQDWPQVTKAINAVLQEGVGADGQEIHVWLKRSEHHLMTLRRDLNALAPWYSVIDKVPPSLVQESLLLAPLPLPNADFTAAMQGIKQTQQALAQQTVTAQNQQWLLDMGQALTQGEAACREVHDGLLVCADRAEARAFNMDFRSLYDNETHTFVIGHNLDTGQLDQNHYDLLASEARLASYFAIAKRDVPVKHWFHLGRPITGSGDELTILSWNGSMFEYLMPALLLPSEADRLLGQSERAAVAVQQAYGAKLGLPWGVSESGFAARNEYDHYQYQAFGVPGLGIKRGLADDYVIAPYASALALSVAPVAATANLRRLDKLGLCSRYGFFEAADFTPQRLAPEHDFMPVRSYMAHHQGMISAAIGNVLNNNILIKRLNRDPQMRASALLLQERVPWDLPPEPTVAADRALPDLTRIPVPALHSWRALSTAEPQLQVLGNGSLASWVTDCGASALWWRGQAVTHWSGDALSLGGDTRIYIQDRKREKLWSLGKPSAHSDVIYHGHKVEFHDRKDGLATQLDIIVAPNDDAQLSRITLTNDTEQTLELDVTSYGELVLSPATAHERHPAFSKLFVHSEYLESRQALLFERRAKSPAEQPPVMLHRLVSSSSAVAVQGYETSRRQFLGRHGNLAQPLGASRALAGTTGWTLDPIMALQGRVKLAPGARVQLDFVTLVATSREEVLELAERFASVPTFDWVTEDARRTTALAAQHLGLDTRTLIEGQALCRDLVFPRPPQVSWSATSLHPLSCQSHLWSMGLSGDLPIVLVRIAEKTSLLLGARLIRLHRWWQRCGLNVDLVFLQESAASYQEPIREQLFASLREANIVEGLGGNGGIHLLNAQQLGVPERRTLEATARCTMAANSQSLVSLAQLAQKPTPLPRFQPLTPPMATPFTLAPVARPEHLLFDNTLGGFVSDSGDYVIHLEAGQVTPDPWCNVLANDTFGTIVSEAGLGFTWSINSGEHRLTPWSNDPVRDPQTEALYIRDEETAAIWSPTPLPAGNQQPCQIHHQAGATTWLRHAEGLKQELTVFVPPEAPVKLALLTLTNPSDRERRLTVTYYAEWLLGALASTAQPHVVCGFDATSQALIARNDWGAEFAGRTAFLAASRPPHSLTCDRASFLGRQQDLSQPAGLLAWSLDGVLDKVTEPAAAFQVHIDLAAGATEEVAFVLGEGEDLAHVRELAAHWTQLASVKQGGADNHHQWQERLSTIQVTTPDPAFDLMVNRWLLNQNIASRILARAGFQQAGGAFGFRDQLQDMMALLFSDPKRVRAHILTCAARQFEEGDVLHWWHPPLGRGVKTHFSDDLLWLVYATGRYVKATGDVSILTEPVPFLSAPPLKVDEPDRYSLFEGGDETDTLFEHCRRALNHGVTKGAHGLPLMGSGDWNDGMDRVGSKGRGESVWLAWFAADCADRFAELALLMVRPDLDDYWRQRAHQLRQAADNSAWDGNWYLRAFADDGLPWGASSDGACQIDSISQSWSVLANGLSPKRSQRAMASATERLLNRDARLIRLLTPPFGKGSRDPGYIAAYPPGVRENGGQYTHAAAWLGLAHAQLGHADLAYEIFDLINPIGRTYRQTDAEHYRGEPYVLAADIRGVEPHVGEAGWSWYTGAAGWTWQLAVEGILGITLEQGEVCIAPRLPAHWEHAHVRIKGPKGSLSIRVSNPQRLAKGEVSLTVQGKPVASTRLAFPDDGTELVVTAVIGR